MKDAQACTGAFLLQWRRNQLLRGGRPVDLDWLLDLAGGVSWSALQQLRNILVPALQQLCSILTTLAATLAAATSH